MIFVLKSFDERRIGVAFPHEEIQGGSLLGAGRYDQKKQQRYEARCAMPMHGVLHDDVSIRRLGAY
jgi:hypothetical protein